MKAFQYIYTSWKNGDLQDKGFMIYSKSPEIADAECDDIRFVMQYSVPQGMKPNPTPEEIKQTFPYAFACFRLSENRYCIAQSTYLGRDYSGRYGNYLIYALVFNQPIDFYPFELFGNDCIKTYMTDEELNATPPVPPLPAIEIEDFGNIVNDESLSEFISEREDELAFIISAVLKSISSGIPLYMNDTRENLVFWFSALQKVFPLEIAKRIGFTTYAGNHEKFRNDMNRCRKLSLCCFGVLPSAIGFDYAMATNNSRQIVVDFEGGNVTSGIEVFKVASFMASGLAYGMDDLGDFHEFLGKTSYCELSETIEDSYLAYDFYKNEEFGDDITVLERIVSFADKYCGDEISSDIAMKLINNVDISSGLSIDSLTLIILYLYKNASFMRYTIHEFLYNVLFEYNADQNYDIATVEKLLNEIKQSSAESFADFLTYYKSTEIVAQSRTLLDGNHDQNVNIVNARFILSNYKFPKGIAESNDVGSLLKKIMHNIGMLENSVDHVIEMISCVDDNPQLISDIMAVYLEKFDNSELMSFSEKFGKFLDTMPSLCSNELLRLIRDNPATKRFSVVISASFVKNSEKPIDVFWNIYYSQYSSDDSDLSLLINVYLSKSPSVNDITKIIDEIPLERIVSNDTIENMLSKLESNTAKTLLGIDGKRLINVYKCVIRVDGKSRYTKLSAAMLYVTLLKLQGKPVFFTKVYETVNVRLGELEKKDYKDITTAIFPLLSEYISTVDDFENVALCFYHKSYFDDFTDELISMLKKLEKKDNSLWLHFNSIICTYIIDHEFDRSEARALFTLMSKYYRKFDENELARLRERTAELAVNKNSRFFERIFEKEDFGTKLGKLFKKEKY